MVHRASSLPTLWISILLWGNCSRIDKEIKVVYKSDIAFGRDLDFHGNLR